MNLSPIPDNKSGAIVEMKPWFSEMLEKGLLFHPDDTPHDIVFQKAGNLLFTHDEALKIEKILGLMLDDYVDQVYEAAYPFFMKAFGIQN